MSKEHSHGSVGGYILVALILGVITYFEFAIVEYPQAWLGQTWTYVLLALLSVVKFVMVVMFFMHLKGDDRLYSGFFSSGMVMAVLTFIAMTAMFILPRAMSYADAEMVKAKAAGELHAVHGEGGHEATGLPQDVVDVIESDGRSRGAAELADTPRPADRSMAVEAPMAANDATTYQVEAPVATAAPSGADELAAVEDAAEAADAAGADGQAGTDGAEAGADETAGSEEPAAQAAQTVAWDAAKGQQVFNANCSACHQVTGHGIPGAFPPLADHLPEIYEAGGRELLVRTVLFGLQGQVSVAGATYNGFMPAWAQLDDASLADALNHVIVTLSSNTPADFVPYAPADIAAHRGDGLTPADVHEQRAELGFD